MISPVQPSGQNTPDFNDNNYIYTKIHVFIIMQICFKKTKQNKTKQRTKTKKQNKNKNKNKTETTKNKKQKQKTKTKQKKTVQDQVQLLEKLKLKTRLRGVDHFHIEICKFYQNVAYAIFIPSHFVELTI